MTVAIRAFILTGLLIVAGYGGLIDVNTANAHHDAHPMPGDDATPIQQLFEVYECARCHRLTTPHRLIGPSLWKLGERREVVSIRASIVTPDAFVMPGYPAGLMRQRLEEIGFYNDIKRQPAILDRIVAYLAGAATDSIEASASGASSPDATDAGREMSAFRTDAAPVTKTAFAAFIAAGGYGAKRFWDRTGWAIVIRRRKRTQPLGWRPERDANSDQPVVGVTWYEADAYCRWAGKSLPSEKQWEDACQAMPEWSDAASSAGLRWEWTAEGVWRGGEDTGSDRKSRCLTRAPSHPALDGRHTGFRCRARS